MPKVSKPDDGDKIATPGDRAGQECRLALHLFDLDRIIPELRLKLLKDAGSQPRLNLKEPVTVEMSKGKFPVKAVPFTCGLLTAAMICDILRDDNRRSGDAPVRVYLHRDSGWSRVPDKAPLTLVVKGGIALNPAVFVPVVHPSDLTPLAPESIFNP